jgi:Kdo2-lipid IVA lauroyltransferase/acyltransferase
MQFLVYLFFRAMVGLAYYTPFTLLYRLSDVVCWLFFDVIKYRKSLVFKQLRDCFPDYSAAEIDRIARASYRNLSDILVETFKGLSFKEADIYDRFRKIGDGWAQANAFTAQGRTIIGTGAHYCNWEWGALAMQLYLDAPIYGIYKPIQNHYIDAFMRKRRGQWGLNLRAMYQTSETLDASRDQAWAVFMVSDQSPSNVIDAHWLPLLGRETGFLHGLEKHATHYNYPVFYFHVVRVKRGCYDVTAHLLADTPADLSAGELTRRYAAKLDEILRECPENWLWSHDRWKRQKPVSLA